MRALSCLLLFVVIAMAQGDKPHYDLKDGPKLFKKFIIDFDRHYKDDADEEAHYQAFLKTLEVINKSNAEQSSATFDINNFADYTPEESKHLFGLRKPEQN